MRGWYVWNAITAQCQHLHQRRSAEREYGRMIASGMMLHNASVHATVGGEHTIAFQWAGRRVAIGITRDPYEPFYSSFYGPTGRYNTRES
jgi:hypothetical protein